MFRTGDIFPLKKKVQGIRYCMHIRLIFSKDYVTSATCIRSWAISVLTASSAVVPEAVTRHQTVWLTVWLHLKRYNVGTTWLQSRNRNISCRFRARQVHLKHLQWNGFSCPLRHCNTLQLDNPECVRNCPLK